MEKKKGLLVRKKYKNKDQHLNYKVYMLRCIY